jgi:hypothetical protein
MLGSLPDLFGKFLLGQGHAPDRLAAVTSRVRSRLLCHLKRRWLAYQRLVRTVVPPCSRSRVLGGPLVVPGDDIGGGGEGSDGDAPAGGSCSARRGRTWRLLAWGLKWWIFVDGWRDGVHTGLLCVGGCVLWMQRYQDVVTQLVVRLHEIDVGVLGVEMYMTTSWPPRSGSCRRRRRRRRRPERRRRR